MVSAAVHYLYITSQPKKTKITLTLVPISRHWFDVFESWPGTIYLNSQFTTYHVGKYKQVVSAAYRNSWEA